MSARFLAAFCQLLIPGVALVLAYLPMKDYRRLAPVKLGLLSAGLVLVCSLAGALLSAYLHLSPLWLLLGESILCGLYYVRSLQISHWKALSVWLAVCGAFSCLGSASLALNGYLSPGEPVPPLSVAGSAAWLGLCLVATAAAWYPATHAARRLLEDEFIARTWYVFSLVPALFIGLNLALIPKDPWILDQGRLRPLYLLLNLVFLVLLLVFYALFYLMASSLNHNDRLRRENQLLALQQARYQDIKHTIEQTRQARHDMRHHFLLLQGLAAQGNWEQLKSYLEEVQGSFPEGDLGLCENPAADSIVGYFAQRCREKQIPLQLELKLPAALPVAETEFCAVLSNLLENAFEASLRTVPSRRRIRVRAELHGAHMVLLAVENTYDGAVREKDGVFLSSKRAGEGVGLQAVRQSAEKTGGYARFQHAEGLFAAHVILRGKG